MRDFGAIHTDTLETTVCIDAHLVLCAVVLSGGTLVNVWEEASAARHNEKWLEMAFMLYRNQSRFFCKLLLSSLNLCITHFNVAEIYRCFFTNILWFRRSVYLYSCAHRGSRCIRQDRYTGSHQGCWHKRVSTVSQPGHCGTAHIHQYLKGATHTQITSLIKAWLYMCVFTSVSGTGWQVPVQVLLSLPEMVYPGSQVQWVVPCVIVQRDGRTRGPLVAAGMVEAAAAAVAGEAAADVFVIVTKTESGERGEGEVRRCGVSLHPLLWYFSVQ